MYALFVYGFHSPMQARIAELEAELAAQQLVSMQQLQELTSEALTLAAELEEARSAAAEVAHFEAQLATAAAERERLQQRAATLEADLERVQSAQQADSKASALVVELEQAKAAAEKVGG